MTVYIDDAAEAYAAERSACWQTVAEQNKRGHKRLHAHYQSYLRRLYRFLVPEGLRVLELGCAEGDLLAALKPACGVGVDFTPYILDIAQKRHPECGRNELQQVDPSCDVKHLSVVLRSFFRMLL